MFRDFGQSEGDDDDDDGGAVEFEDFISVLLLWLLAPLRLFQVCLELTF